MSSLYIILIECPFAEYGKKCIGYVQQLKSYYDATNYCDSMGFHLATIQDADTQTRVAGNYYTLKMHDYNQPTVWSSIFMLVKS